MSPGEKSVFEWFRGFAYALVLESIGDDRHGLGHAESICCHSSGLIDVVVDNWGQAKSGWAKKDVVLISQRSCGSVGEMTDGLFL